MKKIVKCPTCQKNVEWSKQSAFRPFCSERCRLIDLGEWADEKHAIPAESLTSTEGLPYSNFDDPDSF